MKCHVCINDNLELIYQSPTRSSITSLCTTLDTDTLVHFCPTCGHVQSAADFSDLQSFYGSEYNILVESEEEDQIYEVVNGKTKFRTEHQREIMSEKLPLTKIRQVLDFGCAKSSMMRSLVRTFSHLDAHLYDVSDRYVHFWKSFLPEDRWAIHSIPADWNAKFDVVTSFFSLEHILDLPGTLRQIHGLLRDEGYIYALFPNFLTNPADLIVVDHVNHFTETSISHLFHTAGFELMEADYTSHRGAWVVTARRSSHDNPVSVSPYKIKDIRKASCEIANYWSTLSSRIRDFENSASAQDGLAIYGAGFYGNFILSALRNRESIRCFIDQSPFMKGKMVGRCPILPPAGIPGPITKIMVGLNPMQAKKIISDIPDFKNRQLQFFYL